MSYIGQPYGLGKPTTYTFTATGGETTLTTSDDGRTLTYTPGNVEVFLNGVRLVSGVDYTALSGSSVSGLDPLVSGDVVVVVVLASQSVADAVSAASGGEFLGDVTVPTLNASTVGLGDGTAISSLGADSFRVTADVTSSGVITSWEPVDEATSARLGSNVTESSGVFNVPNDGIWLVHFFAELNTNTASDDFAAIQLFINGNENILSAQRHTNQGGTYIGGTVSGLFIGNLTPSDDVDLRAGSFDANTYAGGSTSTSRTAITFVRLGDA